MNKVFKKITAAILTILVISLLLVSCSPFGDGNDDFNSNKPFDLTLPDGSRVTIPAFDDSPYYLINNNQPFFTDDEIVNESYEYYSKLDALGRCGETRACIGIDLMPTEDRGSIGSVKPSGWQTVKYDIVDGKYLYNRCHLIGFQLTGENANKENLITGTRYMNVEGMLPFEKMVAAYIKETENHVMYRATPIYEKDNLVANGVLMEAFSVEDKGDGICFCVYVYNNQPGILINYRNGDSRLDDGNAFPDEDDETNNNDGNNSDQGGKTEDYLVINTNSGKFHKPSHYPSDSANAEVTYKTPEELMLDGYSPCGTCKP